MTVFTVSPSSFLRLLVACVCVTAFSHPLQASTYTWTGLTSGLWSNATNWDPTTGTPGGADDAIFNGTGNGNTTIDLSGTSTVLSLRFDTNSAAAYTIGTGAAGSQSLQLANSGSVAIASTVAANQFVNARLSLGTDATVGSYALTNDSVTNSLTFAGPIIGDTGGTAGAKALTLGGAGNMTISGAIQQGGGTQLTVSKTGVGTLTLSGANTFSGDITINTGMLVAANSGDNFGNSGALGNVRVARTIAVNSGAALTYTAANVTGAAGTTPAATLVVNAGATVNSGTNTYNSLGPVTLSGGTINTLGGFSAEFGGFGLRGDITVSSSSTTTSTLASPSGGASSVFTMLKPGGVTFNVGNGSAATDLLVSGVLVGSVGLTKAGEGTMVLGGANTFSGDITINTGTLVAANSGNDLGNSGALGNVLVGRTITVNDGAALNFTAGNVTGAAVTTPAATLVVNAGATVNSGTNTYNSLGPVTLSGGTINTLGGFSAEFGGFGLRGDITVSSSSTTTSTLASPSGGASSVFTMLKPGGVTFNVGSGSAVTDLLVSGVLGGSVGLNKAGDGTMVLAGVNTYTGPTTVDAGALIVNGTLVSNVVVGSGATLGGSGRLGNVLSGAGTISVGNSPGIGTAASVDPVAGTDWVFEITGTAPAWNAGASPSVNDVLRLTAATPFLSNITSGNVVDVLFNLTSGGPISQGTFLGGFFSDQSDFTTVITNGAFEYWVLGQFGDSSDQREFAVGSDGSMVWYSKLTAYDSDKGVSVSVVPQSVSFDGTNTVNGYSTQFVVVPEPSTVIFAAIGITLAGWSLRKRRRTSH